MQPSGESPSKRVSPVTCTGERGNPTAFQCPEQTLWGVLILPVSSKKKGCKQRLSWASCICIRENKQNTNKAQECCTPSQLWSWHRRTHRYSCTTCPFQPGRGSAAQGSPPKLRALHTSHRATVHSFFPKTLGCWGTAATSTALWRADKACALCKIKVLFHLLSKLCLLSLIISPVSYPIINTGWSSISWGSWVGVRCLHCPAAQSHLTCSGSGTFVLGAQQRSQCAYFPSSWAQSPPNSSTKRQACVLISV